MIMKKVRMKVMKNKNFSNGKKKILEVSKEFKKYQESGRMEKIKRSQNNCYECKILGDM